jgi:hypothetical protein
MKPATKKKISTTLAPTKAKENKEEKEPIDEDKEILLREVEEKLRELEAVRSDIEASRKKPIAARISSSLIARRCLDVTDPKNVNHDELYVDFAQLISKSRKVDKSYSIKAG